MKRYVKAIGIVILIPFAIVILSAIALYIPFVQQAAVNWLTASAGKATGMKVRIGAVRLAFPLSLSLHDVEAIRLPKDTLLELDRLILDVQLRPLFDKQVKTNALEVKGAQINTFDMIDGMILKGYVGKLSAKVENADLNRQLAWLKNGKLSDANITLQMIDTTIVDTSKTIIQWKIALDKLQLNNSSMLVAMPSDSIWFRARIGNGKVTDLNADLFTNSYKIDKIRLDQSAIQYDGSLSRPTKGLDPSHIRIMNIMAEVNRFFYNEKLMYGTLQSFDGVERSGLHITSIKGSFQDDSVRFSLPDLKLTTPYSKAALSLDMPWHSIDEDNSVEQLAVAFNASLGKNDLLTALGPMAKDFRVAFPTKPVTLSAQVRGNMKSLTLNRIYGDLPGVVRMELSGQMTNVADSVRRAGSFRFFAEAGELNFLLDMLPKEDRGMYHIPYGMKLTGTAAMKNQDYTTDMTLAEGSGKAQLKGHYNSKSVDYSADLKVDSLEPVHFMPKDSLFWLAATVKVDGHGTDFYSPRTQIHFDGKVDNVRYGTSSLSDISLKGSLEKNHLLVDFSSSYPLADMVASLDATVTRKKFDGFMTADVKKLDLFGLHFTESPFSTGFQLYAEAKSDMKENHDVDMTLGNWELTIGEENYEPKTLTLLARSHRDTTRVSFHVGDLGIELTGNEALPVLSNKLLKVSDEVMTELQRDTMINVSAIRLLLPDMDLAVSIGKDNPLYNTLREYGIDYSSFAMTGSTSSETGITLNAHLYDMVRDTLRLDSITANIWQDSTHMHYMAEVKKNWYRRQTPFHAGIEGNIMDNYIDARVHYDDWQERPGIDIGAVIRKVPGGFHIHFTPDEPVLAFRKFKINPDNYLMYRNLKDIEGNVLMKGNNNVSVWLHSMQEEGSKYPVLHAEFNQVDLGRLSASFNTYLPQMNGILSADLQYAPDEKSFMFVADMNVDNLIYEGGRVGEMMLNAVYLPLGNGQHQADIHMSRDRKEILAATALYTEGKQDKLEGSMDVDHMPLEMLNSFIPDNMAALHGSLHGDVTLTGSTEKPVVNGSLHMDTTSIYVSSLGSTFSVDDKKVDVKNNKLTFEGYHIHAVGKNPFVIDGSIDLSDPRMMTNLTMRADNMQVMDSKRTSLSLAYGKLFVDLRSTLKGPLFSLKMRGDLRVLGNTNVTYVLKDSPLTVEDRLADLVTFTSFEDTTRYRRNQQQPAPLGGLDMLMTIYIEPAVQVGVDLSDDESSHINLEGGGDLSFQYTPQGNMFLNGRYTLSGGTIKYALPVIPLKEFTVANGSYVEWSGDPMNPLLNLAATERMRATVNGDDNTPRKVNFDVGISLKEHLENMALQFTIASPEDATVQDELNAMGAEERAKQAVSMMVTGLYLASNSGKVNLNMGTALNSFLQSEINNIAGTALSSVDISFGMDTYDQTSGSSGGQRTDYSFRFSKRFYNDRIRIVLGGRISTGENVSNGEQTFIDDITVEYRLDRTGTRYVKLFHDKNYQSLLEGEITETGAGVVLRRKMRFMRDLFNFKKTKTTVVEEEPEEDNGNNEFKEPEDEHQHEE